MIQNYSEALEPWHAATCTRAVRRLTWYDTSPGKFVAEPFTFLLGVVLNTPQLALSGVIGAQSVSSLFFGGPWNVLGFLPSNPKGIILNGAVPAAPRVGSWTDQFESTYSAPWRSWRGDHLDLGALVSGKISHGFLEPKRNI